MVLYIDMPEIKQTIHKPIGLEVGSIRTVLSLKKD